MKRLMNDFASQDLLLICRDYMPPGPPSALCGMFYIKSHCSNSSNQMNEEWILYTFPKSRIRSSTACEVVLCAVFLMSVLSYFSYSVTVFVSVCCHWGVCMHVISMLQMRPQLFVAVTVACVWHSYVLWEAGGLTAQAVSEMKNHHCKKCDWTHAAFHASEERQRLKMTKDRKERLKLNEGFPLLQEPSPPFSSPLSSLLLSSPLLHTQQPQCYDGSDVGLGGQTGSAPLPPLCAYVNGEAEKERGESYF